MYRVGQDCTNTLYMTAYMVISLPKLPYIHRMYMVLANPNPINVQGWPGPYMRHVYL